MAICYSCFKEYDDGFEICPNCGAEVNNSPKQPGDIYPGTVLQDRYIIGHSIGQGGFGIVYKAFDKKLESIIAVKEFYAGRLATRTPGDPKVIVLKKGAEEFDYRKARFLAESRYMAKFGKHKSIVNVFDFFEENNTAYITMGLLEGESLSSYLKREKSLDVDATLMITKEVALALQALHNEKIIHRDVAPDNIWICSNGDIKLLDLGAAKLADAKEDVIDKISKVGYTPPEQYADTDNVGPTNDVYALGATMYRCLTGELPCESTNRKEGQDELKEPRELNPNIPENINNIVMKAMAIERHMRFKNMQEFINALEGNMKVVSIAQEKKYRRRKRVSGIAVAFAVLILIAGLLINNWEKQKKAELLSPATITVWFSIDEDSDETKAMEAIEKDFESKFEGVNIEVTAIPASEYNAKLEEAAKNGELPNVFESTNVSETVMEEAVSLENITNSDIYESYLVADSFENSDMKKLTLAVNVPVAFIINNGPVSSSYNEKTFKDISNLGSPIAFNDTYKDVIGKNFDTSKFLSKSTFVSNPPTTSVMIGTTCDISAMKETLINYTWMCSYYVPKNRELVCESIYEWSMGPGTKEQVAASERLLLWMSDNVYQQYLLMLYASSNQYGWIPVNGGCLSEKCNNNKNFAGLINDYSYLEY